jgi:hypothetical protein
MAWLSDYRYRKKITITGSQGAGTGYQVLLNVGESSGSVGADFHLENHSFDFPNDIRFTSSDGITEYSYWIEEVTGTAPNRTAKIWVKVDESLDTDATVCVYYYKENATGASNGDDTFLLFDDFEGTILDTEKWNIVVNEGTLEVTNGYLRMYRPEKKKIEIASNILLNGSIALEFKHKILQSNYYFGSFYYGDSTYSSIGYALYSGYESALFTGNSKYPPRCGGSTSTDGDVITNPAYNTWFRESFRIPGGYLSRVINNNLSEVSSRYTGVNTGFVGIYAAAAYNVSMESHTDWIAVRKYIEPEPTFFGASSEELHSLSTKAYLACKSECNL